jgi:hypothetical protein
MGRTVLRVTESRSSVDSVRTAERPHALLLATLDGGYIVTIQLLTGADSYPRSGDDVVRGREHQTLRGLSVPPGGWASRWKVRRSRSVRAPFMIFGEEGGGGFALVEHCSRSVTFRGCIDAQRTAQEARLIVCGDDQTNRRPAPSPTRSPFRSPTPVTMTHRCTALTMSALTRGDGWRTVRGVVLRQRPAVRRASRGDRATTSGCRLRSAAHGGGRLDDADGLPPRSFTAR